MKVSVQKVLNYCLLIESDIWSTGIVSPELVKKCISDGLFHLHPIANDSSPKEHAKRIAGLLQSGWSDEVCIDVGISELEIGGCTLIITDGCHRLYAAFLRHDDYIEASVAGFDENINAIKYTEV